MKSTFAAAAAFSGLVSSASAQYFGLITARSGSAIHLQEVAASGQALWVGKPTASYCPSNLPAGSCPSGEYTDFGEYDGHLSMAVVVPGGQAVYIDPECGAVKYTQAHSAAMPEGAITTGWSLEQLESFGELSFTNGLLFCSTSGNDSSIAPWQMFATLPGLTFGDECTGASLIASNSSTAGAWQYT